jgi:DNA-binding XRE family transcriptional regulator
MKILDKEVMSVRFTPKQARKYRGYTLRDAAKHFDIAIGTYMKYENEPFKMSMEMAERFTAWVDMPFPQLNFLLNDSNILE